MKELTRDEVRVELTEEILGAWEWDTIQSVIEGGFKGVENMTDEELIEEWEFYFEESINIKD